MKADNAPDRHLILPTVADVAALREQNQPFAWKISEELLRRQFLTPEDTQPAGEEQGSGGLAKGESSRLIGALEKSIAVLERELDQKNSQITAMNERLRESNILMKDLQARWALPAPKTQDERKVPDASVESPRTRKQPPPRKPSRRPFSWLFRK